MIGCHVYAISTTRCNIVYPISVVSWYNQDPCNEDMIAFNWALMYLDGVKGWCLNPCKALRREGQGTNRCDVDSDYVACPVGFQMTSGLDITLHGADDRTVRM